MVYCQQEVFQNYMNKHFEWDGGVPFLFLLYSNDLEKYLHVYANNVKG